MRLGFSGAQNGMTEEQYMTLDAWLHENKALLSEIHHGACIGSDEEFNNLCWEHGLISIVHLHPCNVTHKMMSLTQWRPRVFKVWPVDFPLERNLTICQNSDVLIATPSQDDEVLRSGTWATIRRARKLRRLIKHVRLDGTFDQ